MVGRFLQSKIGEVGVVVLMILVLALLMGSTGCQMDLIGPSVTAKVLYKGENGNQEHLSRAAGMTSTTGWNFGNPNCLQ